MMRIILICLSLCDDDGVTNPTVSHFATTIDSSGIATRSIRPSCSRSIFLSSLLAIHLHPSPSLIFLLSKLLRNPRTHTPHQQSSDISSQTQQEFYLPSTFLPILPSPHIANLMIDPMEEMNEQKEWLRKVRSMGLFFLFSVPIVNGNLISFLIHPSNAINPLTFHPSPPLFPPQNHLHCCKNSIPYNPLVHSSFNSFICKNENYIAMHLLHISFVYQSFTTLSHLPPSPSPLSSCSCR